MSAKLGEILVRENLISPQHLREALDYQREHGGRLGFNLVKLGLISDDMITAVLSRQYGVPSINLDLFHIEPDVIKLISQDVALKYTVLPISKMGPTLTLAMADPTNVFAIDDIKFITSLNVEPACRAAAAMGDSLSLDSTLRQCLADEKSARDQLEKEWTQFTPALRQRCVATTQTGGDPSYVEVLVCLQMGRDAGQIQRN